MNCIGNVESVAFVLRINMKTLKVRVMFDFDSNKKNKADFVAKKQGAVVCVVGPEGPAKNVLINRMRTSHTIVLSDDDESVQSCFGVDDASSASHLSDVAYRIALQGIDVIVATPFAEMAFESLKKKVESIRMIKVFQNNDDPKEEFVCTRKFAVQFFNDKQGTVSCISGFSGAGKSFTAKKLRRPRTVILDGDGVREFVNVDLGFTNWNNDFEENNARVSRIAYYLALQGLDVIVSTCRGDIVYDNLKTKLRNVYHYQIVRKDQEERM